MSDLLDLFIVGLKMLGLAFGIVFVLFIVAGLFVKLMGPFIDWVTKP